MSILFIILAGISKAVADTLIHHYYSSIFKRLEPKFWDPSISWQYAKKVFAYKIDAWHLSNSLMVIFFCLAVVFHSERIAWYYELLIAGCLFNLSFNVFYNKVFR